MIHEVNTKTEQFQRIGAGQVTAKIVDHDRDYQAGDELLFYELDRWGSRKTHYVDRDSNGRFASRNEPDAPVRVEITHILSHRHCDGLQPGKVLLSFTVLED